MQEAWLRLARADDVDDPPAWLTTVVTRLCLDLLRRRSTRSSAEADAPAGPEPVDPQADALIAERVGGAMQVVLDTLAPAERAAFVLHDVFDYPFDEVSAVLGRSETAVRQLTGRARRKVQGAPEPSAERAARAESRRIVEAFLAAARGDELKTLLSLLAPDAVMHADKVGLRIGADSVYDGAEPWPPGSTAPRERRRRPSTASWAALGSSVNPEDFVRRLDADPVARAVYDRLTTSQQRQHVRAIESAKQLTTRRRRIEKALAALRSSEPRGRARRR